MELAGEFLKSYSLSTKFQEPGAALQHEEILRYAGELPKDKRDRASRFNLGYRIINIRKQVEAMRDESLTPEESDAINSLYEPRVIYKCHKPWCDWFSKGFESEKHREQHINRHDRPFRCPMEGCFGSKVGFNDMSKLDQHKKDHHPDNKLEFPNVEPKKKRINIWKAAKVGDLATVSTLLDNGVDASKPQRQRKGGKKTPLQIATEMGHLEVCKLLLERAPLNKWTMTSVSSSSPMGLAIKSGRLDLCDLFAGYHSKFQLKLEADTRAEWLDVACEYQQLDILEFFLKIPVKGTERSYKMDRLISTACRKGFFSIVQCLLEHGYSKAVVAEHLDLALREGHDNIAGLLRPIRPQPTPQPTGQALQDYQMQLMLTEQNNQRLLMKCRLAE